MRITCVSVKQLFGIFDHCIPLHKKQPVTIIHGPNGFGKTVILSMIAGFLQGKRKVFEHTPFSEFCIEFNDGTARLVRRRVELTSDKRQEVVLEFLIRDVNGETRDADLTSPGRLPNELLQMIDKMVPGPYQLSGTGWIDDEGNEYDVTEILDLFPPAIEALPREFRSKFPFDKPDIGIFFIETNRLGVKSGVKPIRPENLHFRHADGVRRQATSRVQEYSNDLVQKIRSVLADYAKHSQESDRTFPERLVRFFRSRQNALPPRDILDQMTEIENKRQRLITLGLLDSETELSDLTEEDIERAPEALTIYVGDVHEKLKVFDDLAGRIGSLMDIVNARFEYKRLTIDRQRGFRMISHVKRHIQLDDLSSGEQHELVVLYELLFSCACECPCSRRRAGDFSPCCVAVSFSYRFD